MYNVAADRDLEVSRASADWCDNVICAVNHYICEL